MLRNMFAAVGLCENSKQVEARPRLRDQLIHLARPYSTAIAKSNNEGLSAYEARLSTALEQANYKQLNHMTEQNVMPVLDRRLKDAKIGFRSSEVYALCHQDQGRRLLSLFDRGDLVTGFWERGNRDHIEKVFDRVSAIDFNKQPQHADVLLGKLYMLGKIMSFAWQLPEQMSYELERNPWMRTPVTSFIDTPRPKPNTAKPQ